MCRYLNKNHIEQRRYDSVEVNLIDRDPSNDSYLSIKDLAFEKWRQQVLAKGENVTTNPKKIFFPKFYILGF